MKFAASPLSRSNQTAPRSGDRGQRSSRRTRCPYQVFPHRMSPRTRRSQHSRRAAAEPNCNRSFSNSGTNLQSGNLSAAQTEFSTLRQTAPGGSTATTTGSNSISQEFTQLGQDLQSGNLSAAQQDYSKLQQNSQSTQSAHHHHHGGGGSSDQVNQLFQQLGQELQSGSLSTAQQSYSTLQQDLLLNQSNGLFSGQPTTPSISAIA